MFIIQKGKRKRVFNADNMSAVHSEELDNLSREISSKENAKQIVGNKRVLADLFFQRAKMLSAYAENELAINDFEASCEASDIHTESFYELGKLYKEKGLIVLAIEKFSRVIELDESFYLAYPYLIECYLAEFDIKRAHKTVLAGRTATNREGVFSSVLAIWYGIVLHKLDEKQKAMAQFKIALKQKKFLSYSNLYKCYLYLGSADNTADSKEDVSKYISLASKTKKGLTAQEKELADSLMAVQ